MLRLLITRPLLASLLAVTALGSLTEAQQNDPAAANNAAAPNAADRAGVRYWTTNWSLEEIDVGRLFSRLQAIGIEVPVEAAGDVSVSLSVSVPLNRLTDGQAYRLHGRIQSSQLRLENLQLEDFEAVAHLADGVLTLPQVTGRWVDARSAASAADAGTTVETGSFNGQAKAALLPRGDFEAELVAESLQLDPLMDLLVTAAPQSGWQPAGGTIDGRMSFRAPLNALTSVERWNVQADVELKRFRVGPSAPLTASSGPVTIENGRISAKNVNVRWVDRDASLQVSLQADLQRQQLFRFDVRGNDVPLEALTDFGVVDEIVRGKVDVLAIGDGSIAGGDWTIQGQIGSPSIEVFNQNLGLLEHDFRVTADQIVVTPRDPEAAATSTAIKLRSLRTNYQFGERAVSLSDVSANLFGGTINGDVTLARDPALAHRVALSWNQIRPQLNVAPLLGVSAKISALSSGTSSDLEATRAALVANFG